MSCQSTVYRVFIASPSDVTGERAIIRQVVYEWNYANSDARKMVLLPVGWDTHSVPEMGGGGPQKIINKKILKDCDLLVGVFWTRIGTATEDYDSGTIEEIEGHIAAGKPAMLYFSKTPVVLDSVNQDQYSKLIAFRNSLNNRGLYFTYDDNNDFKNKFWLHLQREFNQDKYFDSHKTTNNEDLTRSMLSDIPNLSKESTILLIAASKDKHGMIISIVDSGGLHIQTNGQNFVEGKNPRENAIYEAALEELEYFALIKAEGYRRETFILTAKGYEVADLIKI